MFFVIITVRRILTTYNGISRYKIYLQEVLFYE